MKFQSKIISLKSGAQICIRVPNVKEAQDLIDLKKAYLRNTSTIPLTLEEYSDDVEKESNLIKEYSNSKNSILLIAEFDNEFIGNIDLTGSKLSKMAHTAMIGMGIKEQWRNQGLGKALIEHVIDWAKKHSAIELIWLDVYATNELGLHLYKKTGFEVSGVIKNFFKGENGYIDKVQMFQDLSA